MFEKGIFGGLFDLNGDGRMSAAESALEFMFLDEMEKEDEADSGLWDAEIDEYDLDCMDEDGYEI